jgi:hypothetical protein
MIAGCSDLIEISSLKFRNKGAVHSQFASVASKYKFELHKKEKEFELNSNSCALFKTFMLEFMQDTGTVFSRQLTTQIQIAIKQKQNKPEP